MNKLLILILCFLYAPNAFAQEKTYLITGKVSGNDWKTVSPLIHAYIQIKEKPETGFLTDSSGYFQIDHLKKGKYHITVSFVGFESRDTTIRIRNRSTDTLHIILPLYYDKKEVSVKHARNEIKKGQPHLYVYTEDEKNTAFHTFYQQYKVWFTVYNPQLVSNKRQCLNIPYEVLSRYNQETFKYLNKAFGQSWRQEVPPGIIGFEQGNK